MCVLIGIYGHSPVGSNIASRWFARLFSLQRHVNSLYLNEFHNEEKQPGPCSKAPNHRAL